MMSDEREDFHTWATRVGPPPTSVLATREAPEPPQRAAPDAADAADGPGESDRGAAITELLDTAARLRASFGFLDIDDEADERMSETIRRLGPRYRLEDVDP